MSTTAIATEQPSKFSAEDHPHLSPRKMEQIDRTIDAWWEGSEALGASVEVRMPSEFNRFDKPGESYIDARNRPATMREACSIAIDTGNTFYIDVRKAKWREHAAEALEAFADELVDLACVMRRVATKDDLNKPKEPRPTKPLDEQPIFYVVYASAFTAECRGLGAAFELAKEHPGCMIVAPMWTQPASAEQPAAIPDAASQADSAAA